jgi:hypothetical protein
MPDAWEYPWFAAWDLAFHCGAPALIDVDFAKDQIELMLSERYLNPNGQIPAYEWNFGDVNPPVHALAALKAFRAERVQRGRGDHDFLQRAFHKLLLNYAWWINRKDAEGNNIFEGGFLGLDNISVFDRSQPLPFGYKLKQADATGWMAMFALNMTVIALELTQNDPDYEDIAIQTFEQFLGICDALSGYANESTSIRWWASFRCSRRKWSIAVCSAGRRAFARACACTRAACSAAITSAPARNGKTSAGSTCSPWSITP